MNIIDNGSDITIALEAAYVAKTWNNDAFDWDVEKYELDLGEVRLVCLIDEDEPAVSPRWSMYVEYEGFTRHITDTVTHDDVLALTRSLDELAQFIDLMCEYNGLEHVSLDKLPTFGGPEPDDTLGVYSWDRARVLYLEGGTDLAERWRHEFPDAQSDDDDERIGLIRELRGKGQTELAEQIRRLIDDEELKAAMATKR